ncbi:MAG: AAA family ATPase [Chloroflexota bacterium]|nr:AAA family ATPase [Chloroflexota bacterium]
MTTDSENPRPAWFVGAAFGGNDDQTKRFVQDGVWEGGPVENYGDQIASIQAGDRIAIKSCYTRKNRLPFDNRGKFVAVMAIKATGIVVENLGNRRSLRVDWTPIAPAREWYFHTLRGTVGRVTPDTWWQQALIRFTFDNEDQDINQTLSVPSWRDHYGYLGNNGSAEDEGPLPSYTLDSIMADGCFLPPETLEKALERLKAKKNLILQGPPGTGKTWLAKRLSYALIGHKSDEHVRPIQFHANMAYEDFVQGYRPSAESRLELVDGPFMKLIEDARNHETDKYVMVIEEINRGNPAQIFGEMLTLLEADKRNESEALSLAYSPKRVYIPGNVHVIGTMNVADRSLALVDFALRRRFAFFDLEPSFGDAWHEWCLQNCEADEAFLTTIQQRMDALNDAIASDSTLGKQFCVGHSVVTPAPGTVMDSAWFEGVIETEIRPLLAEYWFDTGGAQTVNDQVAKLTEGL